MKPQHRRRGQSKARMRADRYAPRRVIRDLYYNPFRPEYDAFWFLEAVKLEDYPKADQSAL